MSDWTTTRLNLRYRWKTVLVWGLGLLTAALVVMGTFARAQAWVESLSIALLAGVDEATIVAHRFCADAHCLRFCNEGAQPYEECVAENDQAWRIAIRLAAQEWDDVGAGFRFHTRAARGDEDVCHPRPGEVHVIVLYPGTQLCGGEPAASYTNWGGYIYHGVTGSGAARIYINAQSRSRIRNPLQSAYGLLLHEFGHVAGLGHPDERGQTVAAIMNGRSIVHSSLQPDDRVGLLALHGDRHLPIPMTSALENPRDGSSQSGVGMISGWACDALQLSLEVTTVLDDGTTDIVDQQPIPYDSHRLDTWPACGDQDNGFGLLYNWGNLGDGDYIVAVWVNRGAAWEELGRSAVTITTLGEPFMDGLEGEYVLEDFPSPGQSVVVEWEESLQNFVITEHHQ